MTDTVNAHPTKRLVAYVLTKDIQLDDAVLDLVDNSIDGARRSGKKKLQGFEVKVTLSKDAFCIEDNCGGIPYDVARDYAFRFGRPEEYAPLDGPSELIGNFGVGMKRALLKMGRNIHIVSRTQNRTFEIVIDVESWLADDNNWTFDFSKVEDKVLPQKQTGTTITVTNLYEGVAERFSLSEFVGKVKSAAQEKQVLALMDGLTITVGEETLYPTEMKLFASKKIQPYHKRLEFPAEGKETVFADLHAGIDESDNDRAGWYVICNGRTVLFADQSSVTGWGNKSDSDRVPNYHHQYARFRGYLNFRSKDTAQLPWNTTKTGVDPEHPIYRRCLLEMLMAMRQVFAFLNAVDRESDVADQPLSRELANLKSVPLGKIKPSAKFEWPATSSKGPKVEKLRWIRYQRPIDKVQRAMETLGVGHAEDVGGTTFDIWYELNIGQ